jgi:uncharacterized membrane protein
MAQCPHCGRDLLESDQYCPSCGQPVGSVPEATSSSRPLPPLGDYVKHGWELFKRYPGGFAGFFLLYVVLEFVLNAVPLVGWIAGAVIGPPLIMGNFIVSARLLQGQQPEFGDFLTGFQFILPLLLTSIATWALVAVGFVLLVIPGIYLAVGYSFALFLVIDRRLDFWPAMERSRRTVHSIWFRMFGLMLLLFVINLAGALLLGLGLLISVPLTFCTLTTAYDDIFVLKSNYSGKIPQLP